MDKVLEHNKTAINYQKYFDSGISFNAYLIGVEKDAALNSSETPLSHVPMNLQRITRIMKTIQLIPEMKQALNNLTDNKYWILISEHWCGDASQIAPVINAIAENSGGKIILKIVYRDQNPELIDAHLTNGAKAIPLLLQLNTNFELTEIWGPRPDAAQKLVKELKSNSETAERYAEYLHKWYAQDKQQKIQQELLHLL